MIRKRRRLFFIFPLLASLVIASPASSERIGIIRDDGGEYLPLDEMITRFAIDHSFDMISQKGKLYRKSHYAVYSVGMSALLVDGELFKSSRPVRRVAGRVLIPLDAGEHIVTRFSPGIVLNKKMGGLDIEQPDGKAVRPEKKERSPMPVKDRISFIVIDPGHGGKDPGAVGKGGLEEKDITLAVARHLREKLKKRHPGVRVISTRTDDRFIELSRRTEIANRNLKKNENGIFLSIHVNSSLSGKISGYETFFLSQNPTNEEARNTAALENNVIILEKKSKRKKAFDDLDFIEATMITTQIQKESSFLAESIQNGMAARNKKFSSRGVKKADFFVLRGALMPAALIEIGYISNSREARSLTNKSHRKLIAEGIADGVDHFIKKYNSLINLGGM